MKSRRIIFSFALLLSLPLFAREKTDVIVMKNGDHLTCKTRGLSAGVFSVRLSYAQGTMGVECAQVARLEGDQSIISGGPIREQGTSCKARCRESTCSPLSVEA